MLNEFKRESDFNERKKLHCVRCQRTAIHNLEARCKCSWNDPRSMVYGGERYSIYRCGACDEVCYETASWSSEDIWYDDNDEAQFAETYVQFPPPVSASFTFNTEFTPLQLNSILDEMLYAFAGNKLMLATIGLRIAIEFITKDRKCKGDNLNARIESLHEMNLIDDDQKELLHLIRSYGNSGAHEAKGMRPKQIIAGMEIVSGLVEKIYNGPARHQRTIAGAQKMLKSEKG